MDSRASTPLVVLALIVGGCGGTAAHDVEPASRHERADGVVEITYSSLPDERIVTATADLVIGSEEHGEEYIFGQIRGVEPSADGTIYVFDEQASEIRAFDANGDYLRTVAGPGEGPGEISHANGMALAGDSVLWMLDHRRWQMKGIGTDGGEVAVHDVPVRFGEYVYSGMVDRQGRHWHGRTLRDDPMQGLPEKGLMESGYESYFTGIDYRTSDRDSVYIGHTTHRLVVATFGEVFRFYTVPFEAGESMVVDPDGGF